MGKSNGGATQQQVAETKLPQWVDDASQKNYKNAQDVADNLMGPYEGSRVAGMTPEQIQNIQLLLGNVGAGSGAYDQAGATFNGLAGFNSGTLTPGMLRDTDLSPYMNKFSDAIINPTMKIMEQSRRQALGQVGDQATQSHAFGGSRLGITEGVTNAQSELQKGQFVGQLQSQNFNNAQNMALGDIGRDWTGQVANQQGRQYDANFATSNAKNITGNADARQANFLTGLQGAMTGQDMLQQQKQKELEAQMALYNERRQMPLDRLAIVQNALSNSPYGQTVTTTKPGASTDSTGQALGTASAAIGLAGSIASIV